MLIVIEGVDGAGKTTLVDDLSQLMPDNTRVIHRGPLERNALDEYARDLVKYKPVRDNIICDRWHVGEMVYGPLYRGRSSLTGPQAMFVEMFLQSRGAVRLHVDTPLDVVEQRLKSRGEDFLRPHHVRLVHDFYLTYTTQNGWRHYHEGDSLPFIINEATRSEREVRGLNPLYVGSLNPNAFLVIPGGTNAVYPDETHSTHTLYAALSLNGRHRRWGIVPYGPGMNDLWHKLQRPPAVAIGEHTKAQLASTIPKVGYVYSTPQIVRSMHHMDAVVAYGNIINEELDYVFFH